jgi:hypothetical protein
VRGYIPVEVQIDITAQIHRDLEEHRLLAERVTWPGAVAFGDVRLDAAAFHELQRAAGRHAPGGFLDGVHVQRDQRRVGVGFWGFEPGAEAC